VAGIALAGVSGLSGGDGGSVGGRVVRHRCTSLSELRVDAVSVPRSGTGPLGPWRQCHGRSELTAARGSARQSWFGYRRTWTHSLTRSDWGSAAHRAGAAAGWALPRSGGAAGGGGLRPGGLGPQVLGRSWSSSWSLRRGRRRHVVGYWSSPVASEGTS
jgi:hypothetical protein